MEYERIKNIEDLKRAKKVAHRKTEVISRMMRTKVVQIPMEISSSSPSLPQSLLQINWKDKITQILLQYGQRKLKQYIGSI